MGQKFNPVSCNSASASTVGEEEETRHSQEVLVERESISRSLSVAVVRRSEESAIPLLRPRHLQCDLPGSVKDSFGRPSFDELFQLVVRLAAWCKGPGGGRILGFRDCESSIARDCL